MDKGHPETGVALFLMIADGRSGSQFQTEEV